MFRTDGYAPGLRNWMSSNEERKRGAGNGSTANGLTVQARHPARTLLRVAPEHPTLSRHARTGLPAARWQLRAQEQATVMNGSIGCESSIVAGSRGSLPCPRHAPTHE